MAEREDANQMSMSRSRLPIVVGAFLATLLGALCVAAQIVEPPGATPEAGSELRGAGSWSSGSLQAGAELRWNIDVERGQDGTLSGPVVIEGSPLMRAGTLAGRLSGKRVVGTISDQQGLFVATFSGTLTDERGFQGTFEDRTGGVGRWVWEGPLPE